MDFLRNCCSGDRYGPWASCFFVFIRNQFAEKEGWMVVAIFKLYLPSFNQPKVMFKNIGKCSHFTLLNYSF